LAGSLKIDPNRTKMNTKKTIFLLVHYTILIIDSACACKCNNTCGLYPNIIQHILLCMITRYYDPYIQHAYIHPSLHMYISYSAHSHQSSKVCMYCVFDIQLKIRKLVNSIMNCRFSIECLSPEKLLQTMHLRPRLHVHGSR